MQSFSELSLSPEILRAIEDLGYTTPSPIQAEALPILLGENTDFMGLAGTGTGKTATFAIPLLESIETGLNAVQALILCPTRELANQVAGQINLLGKYKRIRSVAVYGGASYAEQIRGLRSGAAIVVGTPGRVIDHIERGTLKLENLKVLVLDEADEMFSMGFKDELDKVLSAAPRETSNIWLFSATMSRDVRRVADKFLRSPKNVQVNRKEMLSSGVEQYYYPTQESNKPEIICKLIEAADDFYGLIFCQTKALVTDLTSYLSDRGYKVDCLHGDRDQSARERTMQSFRDRKVNILICTDVASRGLDVKDITHVINYSLPRELDSYVHRIGRTARSGKTGIAMNLVTASHRRLIGLIEDMTKSRMLEGRIPTRREIGAKKVTKLLSRFSDQPYHSRVLEVLGEEWKEKLSSMTPEEVAAHFIVMMMPEVFSERDTRSTNAPAVVNTQNRVVIGATQSPVATSTYKVKSKPSITAAASSGPSIATKPAKPVAVKVEVESVSEILLEEIAEPLSMSEIESEVASIVASIDESVDDSTNDLTETQVSEPSEVVRRLPRLAPTAAPQLGRKPSRTSAAKRAPMRAKVSVREEHFARKANPTLKPTPKAVGATSVVTNSSRSISAKPKAVVSSAAKPSTRVVVAKPATPAKPKKVAAVDVKIADVAGALTSKDGKEPNWNPNSNHIPLISRKQRRLEKFGPAYGNGKSSTT